MRHAKTKTLEVGCILLILFCALALFSQTALAGNIIVTAVIPVDYYPYGVAITPNGEYAYVTDFGNPTGNEALGYPEPSTLSVISIATNAVTPGPSVGTGVEGVAVTPNGAYAYVANSMDNTITVINTTTNTVSGTVPVGTAPCGVAANNAYVYVTNSGANTVSVISTTTNAVTATVNVGNAPYGVAITPNGGYAYVTNADSNTVSVISTAANAVTATVNVGIYPDAVVITPNGAYAYVANSVDDTVSVLNTATNAVSAWRRTVPKR